MIWIDNPYSYKAKELKFIASHYEEYAPGHGYRIVEYKVDFDMALDAIGRGHWDGKIEGKGFGYFKWFSRTQQVVIADIYGISNWELRRMGFYSVGDLRWRAYNAMVRHLNGG